MTDAPDCVRGCRYDFAAFRADLVAMGMTQAEFADLTNCSAHRITKWKRAKNGVPGWVKGWILMWRACPRHVRDQIRGVPTVA